MGPDRAYPTEELHRCTVGLLSSRTAPRRLEHNSASLAPLIRPWQDPELANKPRSRQTATVLTAGDSSAAIAASAASPAGPDASCARRLAVGTSLAGRKRHLPGRYDDLASVVSKPRVDVNTSCVPAPFVGSSRLPAVCNLGSDASQPSSDDAMLSKLRVEPTTWLLRIPCATGFSRPWRRLADTLSRRPIVEKYGYLDGSWWR